MLHKLMHNLLGSPQFFQVPYDSALPIVLMHIPKTSGVALSNALADGIDSGGVLSGFDGVLFGGFREFETITAELRKEVYLNPQTVPRGARLVAAHMSLTTLRNVYPNGQYITIMREPYSRIISHWLYWRNLSDNQLAVWGKWANFLRQARGPLSDFLGCRAIACQVDNILTRMLLWPHRLIPDSDFIATSHDRVLLDQAIAKLNLLVT